MSLLVVGTLAFDSVETPFGRRDEVLGGSASFLATAAAFFSEVQLLGVVGEDFPVEHLAFFRQRNIDTQGVQIVPGRTFRWRGHYSQDLNVAHTLETQLNVIENFRPNLPPHYRAATHVVLGNIDPEQQLDVIEQLAEPHFIACDTMNFWITTRNHALKRLLQRIDLLCINEGEARQLAGESNLFKAAHAVRAMGPKLLVIKRGEYGALLFGGDGIFAAPAFPVVAVQDPTGAGDSFAGGLMGFLRQSGRRDASALRQAVVMGSVMASFAVEDFSIDRLRRLHRDDIAGRFAEFKKLTHFDVPHPSSAPPASP